MPDGGASVNALGPVTFDLRRGVFFSVVGPSGCGKSTLLDLVAGLSSPTDGHIHFEGAEARGQVPEGVAVVFQEDASFPWLTVFAYAAFRARRNGLQVNEVKERVDHGLVSMVLSGFAKYYPEQLSDGLPQHVGL